MKSDIGHAQNSFVKENNGRMSDIEGQLTSLFQARALALLNSQIRLRFDELLNFVTNCELSSTDPLDNKKYNLIISKAHSNFSEELIEIEKIKEFGTQLITINSGLYPNSFRSLTYPPPLIFCLGDPTLLNSQTKIAVVGSRRPTDQSFRFARTLSKQISDHNGVVVSGLALGIDSAAHLGALDSNLTGSTIAILGSPVERILPATNRHIGENIIKLGGCIISSYKRGSGVFASNFLERNHLIAALSEAVIIIQAAERSGSLATARNALEYGREIFVAPGFASDSNFVGSNKLIKQGAALLTEYNDLLEYLPTLKAETSELMQPELNKNEVALLKILDSSGEVLVDDLVELFPNINQMLLDLELREVIFRAPGNKIYRR